jgi:hypothetical protein
MGHYKLQGFMEQFNQITLPEGTEQASPFYGEKKPSASGALVESDISDVNACITSMAPYHSPLAVANGKVTGGLSKMVALSECENGMKLQDAPKGFEVTDKDIAEQFAPTFGYFKAKGKFGKNKD